MLTALDNCTEKFPVRRDASLRDALTLEYAEFVKDVTAFSTPTTTNPPAAPAATPCACIDDSIPLVILSCEEDD